MKFGRLTFVALSFLVLVSCANPDARRTNDDLASDSAREVSGTVSLIFAPTVLANLPHPPFDVSFVLDANGGGSTIIRKLDDPDPVWSIRNGKVAVMLKNFSIDLDPGKYRVLGLKINAESLGEKEFDVPFPGPNFAVAEREACTYIGRINFTLLRLPPGTRDQMLGAVQMMSNEMHRPLFSVYLPLGALIPVEFSVNEPKENDPPREITGSSYRFYAGEIEKGCVVNLIRF